MPSIDWNRQMWGQRATWKDRGDEWHFHAWRSRQPYELWKQSVAQTFITPYLGPDVDMLELGPGHGRWTEFMIGRVRSLVLVDLNMTCIEACQQRFGTSDPTVRFEVNDGRTLPVPDHSLDVIWSFAVLVHADQSELDAYLGEFARALRPGGRFLVHHAGWLSPTPMVGLHLGAALVSRARKGQWRGRFDRGAMSPGRFRLLAAKHGLAVDAQARRWGPSGRFALAVGDVISTGHLPHAEASMDGRTGQRTTG
ncbi:MAG TPA: class I SAM-dependent methyltransferase [Acidimicrobiales bacterium]|nr:class I SAM-dependent methyltransferase [Acidimicrobiales bacterium]